MRKIVVIIFIFLSFTAFAQKGIVNKGGNIYIKNKAIVVVQNGDITNQSGVQAGKIEVEGTINLTGNWLNNSTATLNTGSRGIIVFNGSVAQTIGGSSINRINAIKIQNSAGLQLGQALIVDSVINFNTGKFNLSTYNLTISENAALENYSLSKYFIVENSGKIQQTVSSTAKIFPIGISSSYNPVTFKNNGIKDVFSLRINQGVLSAGISGTAVTAHVVDKTWLISENVAGGSNLDIALQWNSSNEAADFIRDTCGIGHYLNGSSAWDTQLAGLASGIDPYQRSISGVVLDNGENAFIVGDKYSDASDGTPPTMTTVQIASNYTNSNWARANSVITLSLTADETLKANPQVEFKIEGKTVTNAVSVTNTSGNNYTATFVVSASDNEGLVTFRVNFTDKKGNDGDEVSSTTDNSKVNVDLTKPQITSIYINSNNANADSLAKVADIAGVYFTLSEANDALPTATIDAKAATVSNVSGLNFRANYTFIASDVEGVVPFTLQCTDSAGNTSNSYISLTSGHSLRFDRTTPSLSTVTLLTNNTNDNQLATSGDEISLAFSSSEDLKASPSITMNIGGSAISGFVLSPTGVASNYTVKYTVKPTDNDGSLGFQINFEDKAGNVATAVNTTSNSSSVAVDVALPTASTSGTKEICQNDSTKITMDLTGDTPWNLTYTDGTNTTNKNGIATSPYEFYVKTAGTYRVTHLSDASGHFAVDFGTSATIVVNPLPTPSFTTNFTTYNTSDTSEVLSGTPVGGVFSGIGITSNDSTFHPDVAGANSNLEIKYTYTDNKNCTNSHSVFVKVLKSDANIISINQLYCYSALNDTIQGTNPKSIIGQFSIAGGKGLTDKNDNTAIIDPSVIGAGYDTITYKYFDGTWLSTTKIIRIDSIGSALNFINLDTAYCADQTAISLIGSNMYPANGTLHWTGPAPDFPGTGNTKSFTPSLLTPDSTYTISVQYESPDNCFSPLVSKTFRLNSLPSLTFNLKDNYNVDSSAVTLLASPSGGIFSGSGVSGNLFVPSVVGVNSSIPLTYKYTDAKGCKNSITTITKTHQAISLFSNLQNTYCYNDTVVDINVYPETNSTTIEIKSYKNGLISFVDTVALYNPSKAGNGTDTITFRYNIKGTEYWIKKTTYIDSIGNVDFITLKPEYCDFDSAVSLNAIFNHPSGSGNFIFSGNGTAFANYGNTATFSPITVIADNLAKTISYQYVSAISGCKASVSKQTIVHPLPVLDFNIALNYNVNGQSDTLETSPSGGVFSGVGMSEDIFYPKLAGIGSGYTITYQYTNPITNCTNKISKITNVQEADAVILGLDTNNIYCYDGGVDTLYGKAINGLPGGYFAGKGITNLTPDVALFNPVVAGDGNYVITYYYIGTDGITQFNTQETVSVDSLGLASIVGLSSAYCSDEPQLTAYGSPQNSNGTFYGPGIIDNGNGTSLFTASLANIGINNIRYIYTNPLTGCSISDSKVVNVHALPKVDFIISDKCIVDSIRFSDQTISTDALTNWHWNFGDNDNLLANESILQNPVHLYTTDGFRQIKLEVTTSAGCKNDTTKFLGFGSQPTADFSWSDECFGMGATKFTNLSSGGNIISYDWNFDDGQNDTVLDPIHQFDSVANYNVQLVIKTQNNCSDTSIQTVYLRPYVSNFPYLEDFETGKNGWVALSSDSINSWEWGIPSKIDSANIGSKAWWTSLDDNYKNNEQSYVIGPCFDFSGLKKPMIGFKYYLNSQEGTDGANLQYSVDNGVSWQNVGAIGDGLNWFNSYIQSTPGGEQQGWSGDTTSGWIEARHDLNNLVKLPNVRFRISFGSDAYNNKQGFGFDSIFIGERKRQVVLENFVNSSETASLVAENSIESLVAKYPLDVVSLYYHLYTSGDDVFYYDNPDVAEAKALLYSVSNTPYAVMDGKNKYNFKSSTWTTKELMSRALVEPKFNISANALINDGKEIKLSVDLQATDSVEHPVVLQAILSENVNGVRVGDNGQTNFSNVVRDILPDAAGTLLKGEWKNNDSIQLVLQKKLIAFNDLNNLRIIVYVQDVVTNEIYQSITLDSSNIATGIFNNHSISENYALKIYPNPVRDIVKLNVPKIAFDAQLILSDEMGKELKRVKIQKGINEIWLEMNSYRSGVYFVYYKSNNGIILSGKIIKY